MLASIICLEELYCLKDEVYVIKDQIHMIKDVNMASLINNNNKTKQELKETIKETEHRLNQKLDKYLEKNEVEHKKFEYQIANLEWKNKIAN